VGWDVAIRIGGSLLITAGCLWPLWIVLGVRWLAGAQGFWQNFAVFGVGAWLLGGVQLIFLLILAFLLVGVWEKPLGDLPKKEMP